MALADHAAVGGIGILERENATVLNATIHEYASFVFSEIEDALRACGLCNCPIFISSNDGSMVPVEEARRYPIQSVASGPANSMLGASYLGSQYFSQRPDDLAENIEKIMILDVGGTTTDAGVLMTNGFPRQASAYSTIANVQVNFSMPDVSSVGLGGGSIVKTNGKGVVTGIGPESVGNELTTQALCFGGNVLTLTDIAVAGGQTHGIGTIPISLESEMIRSAQELMESKVEETVTNAKTQAKPLPVAFVGGGATVLPRSFYGDDNVLDSTLTCIANAIGAATSKLSATTDMIFDIGSSRSQTEEDFVASAIETATEKCVSYGAARESIRVVERQVLEMPYVSGKSRVKVRVKGEFEGISPRQASLAISNIAVPNDSQGVIRRRATKSQPIAYECQPGQDARLFLVGNFTSYHPKISNGIWKLSEVDIEWLSIGCYILGCGGGGSPHLPSIEAKQLLHQGWNLSIVDAGSLPSTAILPPIGLLGSPMVSIERPGGSLCADALTNMLAHRGLNDYDAGLCVEIGGSNGLSPLLSGKPGREARPMVDGDLMGRAFPTFEMITPHLYHEDINHLLPASLASGTGTNMILQTAQNTAAVDNILRACCVTMGCEAGVVSRPLTAKEFVEKGLLHTHSLAWRIGRAVKAVQYGHWTGTGTSAEAVVEQCGGPDSAKILFDGKIVEVSNRLVNGHSVGQLIIEGYLPSISDVDTSLRDASTPGSKAHHQLSISFKNENLIAELVDAGSGVKEVRSVNSVHILAPSTLSIRQPWTDFIFRDRQVLATVPDLITVLDTRTGLAVGVAEYRYGLRVSVLAIAASPKWTSPRGLALAGPAHFG